ncbi:histidinol-phosphate transaminase [Sphingobacteriaceae bacterium]|nr:histidinol-phosphate transaminase [Sphingobacteriaceae bacterium]
MFELNKLVRKNIRDLKPYSSARDEFTGEDAIFLDANENPYGELNRYPDPYQKILKKKLSELKSMPSENIFIGNGSDEIIEQAYRIFCNPGKDRALTFSPTYGMYEVSAAINDIQLITVPLNNSFQINLKKLGEYFNDPFLKVIFICSPNNPTGNGIRNIEKILKEFKGIVIVDEAYIDFSTEASFTEKIELYPNLIILQTLSKAWGLAAARIGIAYASAEVISLFNKVKPPYNVSLLNQQAAVAALSNLAEFKNKRDLIVSERENLVNTLSLLSSVKKIYPSDANFFLAEVNDADKLYHHLVAKKIVTRNRTTLVRNCIRITVGSPAENEKLINALKEFKA